MEMPEGTFLNDIKLLQIQQYSLNYTVDIIIVVTKDRYINHLCIGQRQNL